MNELALSLKERELSNQTTKNTDRKEEKKDYNFLNNIRTIQIRSGKLPPLSPIYDMKGCLINSVVVPKRLDIINRFNKKNLFNNIPHLIDIKRNNIKLIPVKKIKVKKIVFNKNLLSNLNSNDFKKVQFNEPEYNYLEYDESKIFGNQKFYEEIILKKIIELQSSYNRNFTIKKEKTYKYGFHKKIVNLTFESLKITFRPLKNEFASTIEPSDKITFEYVFPFALLPLFYYKDVETFLLILTKVLIWNEETQNFSIAENDDEIIANILKNCEDFNVNENDYNNSDNKLNFEEKDLNENNINSEINNKPKTNLNTKRNSLNNSINALSPKKNNYSNYKDNSDNLTNSVNFDIKKNFRSYHIYPTEMKKDSKNHSIYEFFWITPNITFILSIEVPLITLTIPSHNCIIKKYIEFELMLFIYSKNFVMWHFYLINNLLSYKKFRSLLDSLYSLPQKKDVFFYLTEPKYKKNLFTNYELTSIITRKKNPRLLTKMKDKNVIDNIDDNVEQLADIISKDSEIHKSNSNNNKTYKYLPYFNSTFVQKGLLAVATFMNDKTFNWNEFTFHFNLDQLRKFQLMEKCIDKLSLFVKFLNIDYEKEAISFDFNSFDSFNESSWINEYNKYNLSGDYCAQDLKNQNETHTTNPKLVEEFSGMIKDTKIRAEMKCPIIIMKALDENGFTTSEIVNVDLKVEKILSNLTIVNCTDLNRQLVQILKDNNFCRKIYISKKCTKRNLKRKKLGYMINSVSINSLINNPLSNPFGSLDIVHDIKE